MSISLNEQTLRLVEEQMKKCGYASADDVVRAGIASLARHGDFEPDELDQLLAEGEADIARGDLVDGEEFFRDLQRMSDERRRRERGQRP